MGNFYPNMKLVNGIGGNGWYIGISEPTVPGFPFELTINSLNDTPINLLVILHETSQNQFNGIPLEIR